MVSQASVVMKDYKLLIQLKNYAIYAELDKIMLIMFSERLGHRQPATRIYVADAFCLPT